MAVTNQRGVYEFRELLHGQYNNNSKLEENAVRMMPRGVKIVYILSSEVVQEVGRTRQGRATQGNALGNLIKSTIKDKSINRRKQSKEWQNVEAERLMQTRLRAP
jgi:hypothetical protein